MSRLHDATERGDLKEVIYLVKKGICDVNTRNSDGNTPLHLACYSRSLDTVKFLLKTRCSTKIPNRKGEFARHIPLNENGDCLLHFACQWGVVDIVRYLVIDERCNPNVQSSTSENTPLHIAARYGQDHTIVQLLSCKECDINAQNKKGDTPLHVAVRQSEETAVSKLLADQQCSPDVQNNDGDTPLHIACCRISLNVIKLLLTMRCSTNIFNKKGETVLDIPLNEDKDCLLHIACQWGDVDIVRYLITDERCNPNIQSSTSENTPLHIAAKCGQVHIIVQLLSYEECNPNVLNKECDTPLHIAATWNKTAVVSELLTHQQIDANAQNKKGNTSLHMACYRKSLDIIKLLLEGKCSTNIPNKKGETAQIIPLNEDGDCLLHIACQWGDVDIVKYLITDQRCNLNAMNRMGDTPLHIACNRKALHIIKLLLEAKCSTNIPNKEGKTAQNIPLNEDGDCLLHIACQWGDVDIVRYLITDERCNPNIQSCTSENAPLHIAVKCGQVDIIVQLLSYEECNPNVLNNDHLTPLLVAIKHNNLLIATALLQDSKCDPTLFDQHGNTPLHLACISGESEPEMVELAKQLLTSVDPSCVNNAGQTPIELTTNYQLIQAITHMVQCKTKQSVQTYINMFIVGNPETGKSTLVKAICKEATNILWKIAPKWLRRVKNVPLHTAGIIPTTFRSKTFGNTVLYDLAGQVEYYTSHAAVIRSTVISTPPAFIVVVNLSESEEKISQTLRYWWSFIDNHAGQSSAPPEVILVGSHADVVKSTGRSVQEKMTRMSALLKKLSASFHFSGQVALDCRDPVSRKLQHFCFLVNQSCSVLRQTADVDLHCHVLYAFLLERFQGKVACTVSDVATSIKETTALLPQNPDSLIPLISTLSDKGLLLLVKGVESYGEWWIILQKQGFLGEINGTIFAPKSFSQYKDLSWSTGVVPFSKLKNEFPDYNPNMVSGFLTHLEFCFKIEDNVTLSLLKVEAINVEDTSLDVSEEYYFFPALVSVKNPLHVWEENDNMCCKCGWFYQCIRHDQFLTTQFLHVLILRLAFTFALKLDLGDCREDSLSLRRKCSVWKHGIAWVNRVRIETVVEVGLQYQSAIVMMCCPKDKEAKCAQLRSEVIQKLLEAKDEHCKAVKMSESFIHPSDVRYPLTDSMDDVKFYTLTEIARGIICKAEEANALDQRGRNPIPVQDLLLFDPHSTDTSTELLRELFSEKHSMDETVRSQVLETLNSKSEVNLLLCVRKYQI